MAKPIPWEPPLREMIAVLMPTTSPRRLISGPPLLPGLIAAFVWIKSPNTSARSPKEKTKRIELILTLNRDLLGRLHGHHRRHNSADQRAALTIQRFQRSDLLRIDIRRGRERVFFRSGALEGTQTAMLQAVVVQRRNRQAEQRDKGKKFQEILHLANVRKGSSLFFDNQLLETLILRRFQLGIGREDRHRCPPSATH